MTARRRRTPLVALLALVATGTLACSQPRVVGPAATNDAGGDAEAGASPPPLAPLEQLLAAVRGEQPNAVVLAAGDERRDPARMVLFHADRAVCVSVVAAADEPASLLLSDDEGRPIGRAADRGAIVWFEGGAALCVPKDGSIYLSGVRRVRAVVVGPP